MLKVGLSFWDSIFNPTKKKASSTAALESSTYDLTNAMNAGAGRELYDPADIQYARDRWGYASVRGAGPTITRRGCVCSKNNSMQIISELSFHICISFSCWMRR